MPRSLVQAAREAPPRPDHEVVADITGRLFAAFVSGPGAREAFPAASSMPGAGSIVILDESGRRWEVEVRPYLGPEGARPGRAC